MATVTKPIALDESLNTTEVPSRNVADVLAEELSAIASAIGGGGGQGGHTIEGADGTSLSQEPTLQFADADAADDAVNEKTVVNVVRKRTQAQYDAMSAADKAKGIIHINDANAKPLFASQVRYGNGTVEDALDNAQPLIQSYTFTANTQSNGAIELPSAIQSKVVVGFQIETLPSGYGEAGGWLLKSTNGKYYFMCKDANNSAVANAQVEITFYYC